MKKILIVAYLICNIIVSPLMAQVAKFDKVEVKVEGMTCSACATGLERKIRKIGDIQNINIDVASGMLKMEVPADANITQEQVQAQVVAAGYTATHVEINRAERIVASTATETVRHAIMHDDVPHHQMSATHGFCCKACEEANCSACIKKNESACVAGCQGCNHASAQSGHAEGASCSGHQEGSSCSGNCSGHQEGSSCSGNCSGHQEGSSCSEGCSHHKEGGSCSGNCSHHQEGGSCSGNCSHQQEGSSCSGDCAKKEGGSCSGNCSHQQEGSSCSEGCSHHQEGSSCSEGCSHHKEGSSCSGDCAKKEGATSCSFNFGSYGLGASVENVVNANSYTFSVRGSCGMCSGRILGVVEQIDGVSNAAYDLEKQQLTLTIDTTKTNLLQVKQAIAAKGHDTDEVKAENATYENLPSCCKYRD